MMLLTNARDESIIISLSDESEIEIRVVEFEGKKVKVLVRADDAVAIERRVNEIDAA